MTTFGIIVLLCWLLGQIYMVAKLGIPGFWLVIGCHVVAVGLAALITGLGNNMAGWVIGLDCFIIFAMTYGVLTSGADNNNSGGGGGGGGKRKSNFARNVAVASVGGYLLGKKMAKM